MVMRKPKCPKTAASIACLALLLGAADTIPAVGGLGPGQKVSEQKKIIHVGFEASLFSAVDLQDVRIALEIWMKQISDSSSVRYSVESFVYPDFPSLAKDIRAKKLEIVNISALDYVHMPKDMPLEPFLVPCQGDSPLVNYKLGVHKSSGISRLSQLAKETLAIQSGAHTSISQLWLRSLLLENGLSTYPEFFRAVRVAEKPAQAVLPVFFGQVSACLVSSDSFEMMVELNPQVGQELSVLAESPGFLNLISCFHRDFDPEVKRAVMDKAYLLHENPGGQQILTLFRMDKAIPFDPSYLRDLETLVERDGMKEEGF